MADDTLMDLIDAYAEARHVGGCYTYNAKTAEARAKVVASLAASEGSEPDNAFPLASKIYKRGEEWVLEVSGTINDCHFTCRHTQPGNLQPEDVAGLPTLYTHHSPPEGATGADDYEAMFGAAISSLAIISDALGIDEESAACANGPELILEAIQRKNEALLAALQKRPPLPASGVKEL